MPVLYLDCTGLSKIHVKNATHTSCPVTLSARSSRRVVKGMVWPRTIVIGGRSYMQQKDETLNWVEANASLVMGAGRLVGALGVRSQRCRSPHWQQHVMVYQCFSEAEALANLTLQPWNILLQTMFSPQTLVFISHWLPDSSPHWRTLIVVFIWISPTC